MLCSPSWVCYKCVHCKIINLSPHETRDAGMTAGHGRFSTRRLLFFSRFVPILLSWGLHKRAMQEMANFTAMENGTPHPPPGTRVSHFSAKQMDPNRSETHRISTNHIFKAHAPHSSSLRPVTQQNPTKKCQRKKYIVLTPGKK